MADPTKRAGLTRREALILSSTAGVGVAAANFAAASDSVKTAAHQGPGNLTTPRSAIAKTQYGKVRGYPRRRRLHFQRNPVRRRQPRARIAGFPPNRRLRGTDEYPALVYGANCPQHLASLDQHRTNLHPGLGRRLAERRHAQAQHLDVFLERQAPRDGLFPRRWLQLRLLVRIAIA